MAVRKGQLKEIPLFRDLSDKELQNLADVAREVSYPKGSIVFHEGDEGNFMLVVLSGKVKVVLLGPEGQETILDIRGRAW